MHALPTHISFTLHLSPTPPSWPPAQKRKVALLLACVAALEVHAQDPERASSSLLLAACMLKDAKAAGVSGAAGAAGAGASGAGAAALPRAGAEGGSALECVGLQEAGGEGSGAKGGGGGGGRGSMQLVASWAEGGGSDSNVDACIAIQASGRPLCLVIQESGTRVCHADVTLSVPLAEIQIPCSNTEIRFNC